MCFQASQKQLWRQASDSSSSCWMRRDWDFSRRLTLTPTAVHCLCCRPFLWLQASTTCHSNSCCKRRQHQRRLVTVGVGLSNPLHVIPAVSSYILIILSTRWTASRCYVEKSSTNASPNSLLRISHCDIFSLEIEWIFFSFKMETNEGQFYRKLSKFWTAIKQ